jgi:ESCRT-II complex subunit VPS22
MRRKVGVGAIKDRKSEIAKYNQMGKTMDETKLSFVQDLMEKFRSSLTEFAIKHRSRINEDPIFRQQFHQMCLSVGVDPLASNKGFWADLLGVGDFYFELAVKIVEITVQSRSLNGGVMNVQEILKILNKNTADERNKIVKEDILRSIDKVKILGSGFRLTNIRQSSFIISVPMEINVDHEILMEVAQSNGGMFSFELLQSIHGWPKERFDYMVNPLLQEGMIWVDQYQGRFLSCFGF